MRFKCLDENTDLIEGVISVTAGALGLLIGTIGIIDSKGKSPGTTVVIYSAGTSLLIKGVSKIKKYRKEHPVDYEVSSFCSLQDNYCVWDNVSGKTFSID